MSLSDSNFAIIAVLSAVVIAILYNYVFSRFCPCRRPDSSSRDWPLVDLERGSWSNSVSTLIPSCKYSSDAQSGIKERTCSVCLCEFRDGEDVRILPLCSHPFHVSCIDMWLYSHPDCPVCRTNTDIAVLISRQMETESSEASRSMVSSSGSGV